MKTKKRAITIPSPLSHRKRSFLEHYLNLCVIGEAAKAAGVSRRTTELWKQTDKEFAANFESTRQDVVEKLEKEAIRRAYHGVDEPVWYQGEECGVVRKFSDTLLIFLLNGAAPAKYRQRHEVMGKDGTPLPTQTVVMVVSDNARALTNQVLEGKRTDLIPAGPAAANN